MVYAINEHSEKKVVHIQLEGTVTSQDLQRAVNEVYSARAWDQSWHVIWDFRNIRSFVIDYEELKEIVLFKEKRQRDQEVTPDVYLVADPGAIEEDMAKLYRAMTRSHRYQVEVCDSIDKALQQISA